MSAATDRAREIMEGFEALPDDVFDQPSIVDREAFTILLRQAQAFERCMSKGFNRLSATDPGWGRGVTVDMEIAFKYGMAYGLSAKVAASN